MRRAFLLTLLANVWAVGYSPAADKPNLVVILADDLGWGDLGCYGAKDLRTPHIDRLAAEGVTFDNFYANCTVCSPTRASLLTGRYPELAGVPGVIRTHAENSWGWLAPSATTLPQALQPAGYHSALVGKWHLGLESPNTPTERGFDFFHGFLGDMMDDYYHHRRHGNNYMRRNQQVLEPQGHATDLFSDWAGDYIRERAASGRPFFLYLPYNAPHTPIQPPDDWLAKVRQRDPGLSEKRAKLVALIEHMDDGIGRVMKSLKDAGVDERTLVIFTSDNGGQLDVGANNGPWRDGKQSMYEGGLRVSFVARWPGRIPAGSRSDRRALTMDLFPTLCEAAGVKPPAGIDGKTFLPALLGQRQAPYERDLFFTRREGGARYGGRTIDAVIRGDWKLLQDSPWAPLELYNLKSDPGEKENLAEKNKGKFNELSAALRRQIQRGGAVPWQQPE
jgi:arylsulfatase A-like enzyme